MPLEEKVKAIEANYYSDISQLTDPQYQILDEKIQKLTSIIDSLNLNQRKMMEHLNVLVLDHNERNPPQGLIEQSNKLMEENATLETYIASLNKENDNRRNTIESLTRDVADMKKRWTDEIAVNVASRKRYDEEVQQNLERITILRKKATEHARMKEKFADLATRNFATVAELEKLKSRAKIENDIDKWRMI